MEAIVRGTIVKFASVWNSLRLLLENQTDWAIDKLCCKNLFELLILNLFQFFTLKDLVGMYKIIKNSRRVMIIAQ